MGLVELAYHNVTGKCNSNVFECVEGKSYSFSYFSTIVWESIVLVNCLFPKKKTRKKKKE